MSGAWEKYDERTGMIVGRNKYGERIERPATEHEKYYMPRWGKNKHPSQADEDASKRR
jgi:hypothetical protein